MTSIKEISTNLAEYINKDWPNSDIDIKLRNQYRKDLKDGKLITPDQYQYACMQTREEIEAHRDKIRNTPLP